MLRLRFFASCCAAALLAVFSLPANGQDGKDQPETKSPAPAPAAAQQWRERGTAHLQAGLGAYFGKGEREATEAAMKKLTADAIADFTHAIEADPDDAMTYLNRACARMRNQMFKDALTDATRAAELDPKLADAHLLCAWLKLHQGDPDGCIAAARRCLEIQPEDRDAWAQSATAKQRKGDFEEAIHDFSRNLDILTIRPPELTSETKLDFAHPVTLVRPFFHPDVRARYYAKSQWRQAFFDFESVAHWPETRRGMLPYVFVLRPRLDSDFAKKTEDNPEQLRAGLAQPSQPSDPKWRGSLNDFLLGKLDEKALVAAMGGPTADPSELCVMWYFIGMQRLAAGQDAAAGDAFRRSVATNLPGILPYDLSTAELKRSAGR